MKQLWALGALTAALAALPGPIQAQGQYAYTAKDAHLRAGPARDYPVVAVLPAGFQIMVQGCVPDYSWCDVIAAQSRGWIYAANISYPYQGGYVPLLNYGEVLGIAILGFIVSDYWTDWYRDRPWYGERNRWINRPISPVPRFRPAPQAPHPGAVMPGPVRQPQPHMIPGEPRQQPPRGVGPGGQRSQPRQGAGPGGERPQPPQGAGPGAPRPQAPQGAGPGGQRTPQPRGPAPGSRGSRSEGGERQGSQQNR